MIHLFARVAAVSSMVAILVVTGSWPAAADGALGLTSPTGEPLGWALAAVVGLGGLAFVVRAVVRLRLRRKA